MWSIVARYTTLGEAEAARSALDAAEIPSRLHDENVIAVQWLYANATGWVKLLVRDEQREDATELLASDATLDESPDEVAPRSEPDAVAMQCPACSSFDVQRIPRLLIFCALSIVSVGLGAAVGEPALILAAVLVLGLIAVVSPSHRCRSCGERWTTDDVPERPNHAPPPAASETADIRCPRCGSLEIHRIHRRRLTAIPLFVTLTAPIVGFVWLLLPRWKCDACGRRAWFP